MVLTVYCPRQRHRYKGPQDPGPWPRRQSLWDCISGYSKGEPCTMKGECVISTWIWIDLKRWSFQFSKTCFIYFWLCHCCWWTGFSLVVGGWGPLSSCGVWVSHCGGFSCYGSRTLGHRGSVVMALGLLNTGSVFVAHGLCCSKACGIFPSEGSNPHLLHSQADSLPPSHQGSPKTCV